MEKKQKILMIILTLLGVSLIIGGIVLVFLPSKDPTIITSEHLEKPLSADGYTLRNLKIERKDTTIYKVSFNLKNTTPEVKSNKMLHINFTASDGTQVYTMVVHIENLDAESEMKVSEELNADLINTNSYTFMEIIDFQA